MTTRCFPAWSRTWRPTRARRKRGMNEGVSLAGAFDEPTTSKPFHPYQVVARAEGKTLPKRRGTRVLCVTLRVHLAVDEVRTSKLPLATGQRWEDSLCSTYVSREPKHGHTWVYHRETRKERKVLDTRRGAPDSICSFLHWSRGPLTFCKVSIKGGRARQRDVMPHAQELPFIAAAHREDAERSECGAAELHAAEPKVGDKRRNSLERPYTPGCTFQENPGDGNVHARKRWGKIDHSFTLQSGNAITRSPLHQKPPAC